MNTSTEKAIELKNVYYSVGSVKIIKNTTASISKGKITTLVGP